MSFRHSKNENEVNRANNNDDRSITPSVSSVKSNLSRNITSCRGIYGPFLDEPLNDVLDRTMHMLGFSGKKLCDVFYACDTRKTDETEGKSLAKNKSAENILNDPFNGYQNSSSITDAAYESSSEKLILTNRKDSEDLYKNVKNKKKCDSEDMSSCSKEFNDVVKKEFNDVVKAVSNSLPAVRVPVKLSKVEGNERPKSKNSKTKKLESRENCQSFKCHYLNKKELTNSSKTFSHSSGTKSKCSFCNGDLETIKSSSKSYSENYVGELNIGPYNSFEYLERNYECCEKSPEKFEDLVKMSELKQKKSKIPRFISKASENLRFSTRRKFKDKEIEHKDISHYHQRHERNEEQHEFRFKCRLKKTEKNGNIILTGKCSKIERNEYNSNPKIDIKISKIPKLITTKWALSKVNLYDDKSRTYEIMSLRTKIPKGLTIKEDERTIKFSVTPRGTSCYTEEY